MCLRKKAKTIKCKEHKERLLVKKITKTILACSGTLNWYCGKQRKMMHLISFWAFLPVIAHYNRTVKLSRDLLVNTQNFQKETIWYVWLYPDVKWLSINYLTQNDYRKKAMIENIQSTTSTTFISHFLSPNSLQKLTI